MKRAVIFSVAILLAGAATLIIYRHYSLKMGRASSGITERYVVKSIDLSGPDSLDVWEEKALAHKDTEYSVVSLDGEKCLKAISENSASALFYQTDLSIGSRPFLGWEWKVERFPSRKGKESLGTKSEFDFAAQVYVVFHSKFFLNTKAIQYVWTERLPAGTVSSSPYTGNVKIMALESGVSEDWKVEERDIVADFELLFGKVPSKDVAAVAFMTDSDSTDSNAVAYYRNIVLGYLALPAVPEGPFKPGTGNFVGVKKDRRKSGEGHLLRRDESDIGRTVAEEKPRPDDGQ